MAADAALSRIGLGGWLNEYLLRSTDPSILDLRFLRLLFRFVGLRLSRYATYLRFFCPTGFLQAKETIRPKVTSVPARHSIPTARIQDLAEAN